MKHDFEAKHIQQAAKALDIHIRVIQSYARMNKRYQKKFFKKPSIWEKIFRFFKF